MFTWWPVSQGKFAKKIVELNNVDEHLGEMQSEMILMQDLNVAALKALGVNTTEFNIRGDINKKKMNR